MARLTIRWLIRRRRAGSRLARICRPIVPASSMTVSADDARGQNDLVTAACQAVVKPARSGSVSGRVLVASAMAVRSSW
jgi:hypothetical protein